MSIHPLNILYDQNIRKVRQKNHSDIKIETRKHPNKVARVALRFQSLFIYKTTVYFDHRRAFLFHEEERFYRSK